MSGSLISFLYTFSFGYTLLLVRIDGFIQLAHVYDFPLMVE